MTPQPAQLRPREWRHYRGISQAELAARLQMDRNTIIALERPNHRPPWPRTLVKLAAAMDTKPHMLWSPPPSTSN